MILGGHQEDSKRGGTENVAMIAGFGEAARLAASTLESRATITASLRDALESGILKNLPASYVNGSKTRRLPNTTNIGIPHIDSDTLVTFLDANGVCVSSGSACISDAITPSHVVMAMTRSVEKARQALRLSVSHLTTMDDIREAVEKAQRGATLLADQNVKVTSG